jgi:hypothetical protein
MVPTQQQQLARFTYQQAAGWSQTIGEFLTDVKDGAFDAASDSALNELEREMLDDEAYRFPGVEEHVDESVGWQPESAEVDETEALADVETAAFASELKADAATESEAAVDHRSAVEAEAASESESEPEPAMEPKPGNALPHDSSVSGRPALTSLVAGLEALAARCPYVPGIELAVDGDGRMHLLHETLDKPEAGRDAMANLSLVRRWAADHRGLIEQAAGRTVKAERAVAHLFTDEPKPFGRLAYLGEHDDATPLHLHLLKPVTVGEQTAWDHCEIS